MNAVAKVEQPAKPVGVLAAVAGRYQMDPENFKATIKGTVFPTSGTPEELAAFLVVANEYRLNPLTREIYAFPKKGGGIVPIVSIDGWISLVNSHPQFKGVDFEPVMQGNALVAYTCRIWRKDREMPTVITEYLDECIRPTDPWKMKNRMLRHKALIQCARYAFGFSGVYDEDEGATIAESASFRDVTPPTPPAPPPATKALAASSPARADKPTASAAPADVVEPKPAEAAPLPAEEPATVEDGTITDPDAIIHDLIENLARCTTADAIEEGYEIMDVEANLAGFTSADYVARARAIKKQNLERVAPAPAADDPPAPPATAKPVASLEDDPPPVSAGLVNLADYELYITTQLAKLGSEATIREWWSNTRDTRNKFDLDAAERARLQNMVTDIIAKLPDSGRIKKDGP